MHEYLSKAHEEAAKHKPGLTPDAVAKGMVSKAAQAIFSIKPMQFPQATRKLGDNYIEGFTDDKPVKKFFADKYELLCADTKFCPCYNALFVYEHGCLTRACGQTG